MEDVPTLGARGHAAAQRGELAAADEAIARL
jgi:hypothetical protein